MTERSERANKLLQLAQQCAANKDLTAKTEPIREITGVRIVPFRIEMGGGMLYCGINNPNNPNILTIDFTENEIYVGSKKLYKTAQKLRRMYKKAGEDFIVVRDDK